MNDVVLAVIARDEARCIDRCLSSVRPWVDRMVVLDTGSRDATAALARAAGAQVHEFAWVDDFALARNRALEIADASWCLMLDADEWLLEGGPALSELREWVPDVAGQVRVDSEFDCDDGLGIAPSWMARVAPRGARFVGRIHEQLAPGLKRRRLDVRVGHDGYRLAQQGAKRGRNERLLRLELQQHPDDPYWHYQLAKDLEHSGRLDVCVTHYEAAYRLGGAADSWRHDLILRLLFALKRTAAFARAMELAHAQQDQWSDSPDFHFVVGDMLLDRAIAEPALAPQLLPRIEAAWMQCLALGERPDLEGAVRGRGSFLAAKNLAAFHTGLGHTAAAAQYRDLERVLRGSCARG